MAGMAEEANEERDVEEVEEEDDGEDVDPESLATSGGLRKRARDSKRRLRLNPAQIGFVRRALADRTAILAAMEMGAGKTLAALALACALKSLHPRRKIRALFVVPKSTLHDAWLRQAKNFTDLRRGRDATFATYPEMQRAFAKGWRRGGGSAGGAEWERTSGSALLERRWDLLVFDESHALRNPKKGSLLGSAAAAAARRAKRVVCLSGTPIHNGVADADGQLRAMGRTPEFSRLCDLRAEAVESFKTRHVYAATLEDAGQRLPPKRSEIVYVEHGLTGANAAAYNASLEACRGGGREGEDHHMMTLRQLCADPALYHKHGRARFDEVARDEAARDPGPKIRESLTLIRRLTLEGHQKIVVVSDFVTLLDIFRGAASRFLGEECGCFDGRLSAKRRREVVDDFLLSDRRLLCLSMGAGAYGLHLAPGPTAMIVLSVWFNPQVHRQVEARIHRPGQDKPVEIYTLVARGTVEEKILAAHEGKSRSARAVLNGDAELTVEGLDHARLAIDCERLPES